MGWRSRCSADANSIAEAVPNAENRANPPFFLKVRKIHRMFIPDIREKFPIYGIC